VKSTLLIVGALGIVGRNILRHFERLGEWDLVGISRRRPDFATRAHFLGLDLRDETACRNRIGELSSITHVAYCANYEKPDLMRGWMDLDHIQINLTMLRNLMEPLKDGPNLRHVTLLQGTKAYAAAAGPFKLPAKEDDPRYLAPNFYYAQEDYLREAQRAANWSWTVLRPQFVCGFSIGSPMNALNALAAYITISRELGLPLRFPGGAVRIQEATDARLLAAAAHWATNDSRCANEIFNIVNGDCFTWGSLWPRIAKEFAMEWAPPAPARLARVMADKGATWDCMTVKYSLRPYRLEELVPNWELADNLLGYGTPPVPLILSGLKARRFGFNDCIDSEEMFLDWLRLLQADRIFPGPRLDEQSPTVETAIIKL
jgi:nucleoside-diphosphate-sugar epimerase